LLSSIIILSSILLPIRDAAIVNAANHDKQGAATNSWRVRVFEMLIQIAHSAVDRKTDYSTRAGVLCSIGRFSYVDSHAYIVHFDLQSTVHIGNFTSIAANSYFFMKTNHHVDWVATYPMELMPWDDAVPKPAGAHAGNKSDITIGNDVWIGEGVRVLPGAVVGNGAVIGAGAIVTGTVPAYSLFAGNPGRLVRMRFAPEQIAALERARWWDLPTDRIRKLAPALCSPNIADLLRLLDASKVDAADHAAPLLPSGTVSH
jgi:acetyltransferase-like isoleucine patch superfamily enzyme